MEGTGTTRIGAATLLAAAVLLVGTLPAAAGGGGGGGAACAGFSEGTRVLLLDNCFEATAMFVDAGATVTVRNDGELPHSYTAVDGGFDTGVLDPGEQAQVRPDAPGVYRVYCTLHSDRRGAGMAGVLVVDAGALTAAGDADVQAAGGGEVAAAAAAAGPDRTTLLAAAALALALLALAVSLRSRRASRGVS